MTEMADDANLPEEPLSPEDVAHARYLLLAVFSREDTVADIAAHFTCNEVDRLAKAFMLLGLTVTAGKLLVIHADDPAEEETDLHFSLKGSRDGRTHSGDYADGDHQADLVAAAVLDYLDTLLGNQL